MDRRREQIDKPRVRRISPQLNERRRWRAAKDGAALCLWRAIAHAKASAEVFGKQLNCLAVFQCAVFSEITHGLHNHALSLDVTRISAARALRFHSRTHRDGENFGHEEREYSFASTLIPFRREALLVDNWKNSQPSAISTQYWAFRCYAGVSPAVGRFSCCWWFSA